MNLEEFQKLRETFERLLAAPEQERAALVEQLARGDPAIGSELKRMLEQRQAGGAGG